MPTGNRVIRVSPRRLRMDVLPDSIRARPLALIHVFSDWTDTMLPLFKPSTQHFLRVTIAQLSLSFGRLKGHDVTTEMLQHYVSSLRLSPKTIANRVTVFRTVWKSARSWGLVSHDPFDGLILPKLIPPEPRCFTLEEVTQIIQHSREPYKTLFLLAAETGMTSRNTGLLT